jgi:NADH:ubiquinone oxidoreductase subunit C
MDLEELKTLIEQCELDGNKICIKNSLYDIVNILKNKYSYNVLKSITAVDLGDETELIYNLYSTIDEEDVILSVKVKNEAESIIDLFDSAKADENEIYDMFGIRFIGNDDLKRLYMPENWTGFPLRKDYVQDDTRLAWNDDTDNA